MTTTHLRAALVVSLSLTVGGCGCAGPSLADGGLPDGGREDAGAPARLDAGAAGLFDLTLTVNRVPAPMNGSAPFTNLQSAAQAFRLTLPQDGFSLDVSWDAGAAVLAATLDVSCDVAVGAQPAGANLAERFGATAAGARLRVPPQLSFPVGPARCTARVTDGQAVAEASLGFDVATKTATLDPFRLDDTWLLVFSQDLSTITRVVAQGAVAVQSSAQPNGLSDFEEDLRSIGLGTASMLPASAAVTRFGVTGTNAVMRRWVEREVLAVVRRAYLQDADGGRTEDSVRIAFVIEGEPGAPLLADYRPQVLTGSEAARNFSAISVGGGDLALPYVGLSVDLDVDNLSNEADLGPTYGVFTTTATAKVFELVRADPTLGPLFRAFFGDLIPELGTGGLPVGEHPLDATILAEGFDPATASPDAAARHRKLASVVTLFSRLVGAVVAHEIGHSLGLVADGPPPHGLFGGERNASFVDPDRTTPVHIDTPGLNVMEAGPGSAPTAPLGLQRFLVGEAQFNELNLSYLQGRTLLLP